MPVPLVIDDHAIAELKKFAEENPLDINESIKIMKGESPPPGDREGYVLYMPPCWKLVFSHSQYPRQDKTGSVWVKHMSMSLDRPGRLPNIAAIRLVCDQLGFPHFDKCKIDVQDTHVEVVTPLEESEK